MDCIKLSITSVRVLRDEVTRCIGWLARNLRKPMKQPTTPFDTTLSHFKSIIKYIQLCFKGCFFFMFQWVDTILPFIPQGNIFKAAGNKQRAPIRSYWRQLTVRFKINLNFWPKHAGWIQPYIVMKV